MKINDLENQAIYWELRIQNNRPLDIDESIKFVKFLNEMAALFDDSETRCPHCGLRLPRIISKNSP